MSRSMHHGPVIETRDAQIPGVMKCAFSDEPETAVAAPGNGVDIRQADAIALGPSMPP